MRIAIANNCIKIHANCDQDRTNYRRRIFLFPLDTSGELPAKRFTTTLLSEEMSTQLDYQPGQLFRKRSAKHVFTGGDFTS